MPFDKDLEGHFRLGREAAHGRNRILHVKGDTAGRAIMHALIAAVRATPSITVLEGFAARDLVLRDGRVPASSLRPSRRPSARGFILPASAVVLATGGAGQLYAITTNPREARGEGIAIAARAGAVIADAEFVQFHPTAINIGRDPAPLATEALRGEGALLINARGERFMRAVHADAELGPRDVVARAVYPRGRKRPRRLSRLPPLGPELAEHFPTVFAACRAAGIDPVREPIPVAPAAHYHMGGILTDARAQHARRALGLRRGRLDRRAWREPARLQLAARGGRVRRPRRQDIAASLPAVSRGSRARSLPRRIAGAESERQSRSSAAP